MSGVVIKKGVELGETVTSGVSSFNAGTVLFTVADLKSLIIRVNLNEVDIAKVHVGQPVRVTLDAYPQKVFTGKVSFVSPRRRSSSRRSRSSRSRSRSTSSASAFKTGHERQRRDPRREARQGGLDPARGAPEARRQDGRLPPEDEPEAAAARGRQGRALRAATSSSGSRTTGRTTSTSCPVSAGIATLERVEILAGLKSGEQVALEDPTKKRVEKDDEDN